MFRDSFLVQPLTYLFEAGANIPNSTLPLLLYKNIPAKGDPAVFFAETFRDNNWTNSWQNGIYNYHHFHSNTHEVLAVCKGNALLHLGGPAGKMIEVSENDVIVIPAGVGHKCVQHSSAFMVTGAYPFGAEPDICRQGYDHTILKHIAAVHIPDTDPLYGKGRGVPVMWQL